MLKKFFILILVLSVSIFAIDLNTASKEELMSIKGIGEKKAELILKFRKTHRIKSADDLRSLKGFGDVLISNIKNNVKNKTSKKKQDKNNTKSSKTSKDKVSKTTKSSSSKKDKLTKPSKDSKKKIKEKKSKKENKSTDKKQTTKVKN